MCLNVDWGNPQQLRTMEVPFIRIQRSNGSVVSLEAHGGVIRAIPIFYAVKNKSLCLSDSPSSLVKRLGERVIDELSVLEFLKFGYVTGRRSLFKQIFCIQAGESLLFDGQSVVINTAFYGSAPPVDASRAELSLGLGAVLRRVFDDLLNSLKGKRAIVPLSAGYDSRLIAAMLRLGSLEDVTCYAWGRPGTEDVLVSETVANKLGYKWKLVDYDHRRWRHTFGARGFRHYLKTTSRHTSISALAALPFQDCLLRNEDPDNSVVILGHAADFIAGGHIPENFPEPATTRGLFRAIADKHFLVRHRRDFENDNLIQSEVIAQLNDFSRLVADSPRVCELWDLRERQAKFIMNSNRFYEETGFSWSTPFWDHRFVEFWEAAPIREKQHLRLYDAVLETGVFSELNIRFDLDRRRQSHRPPAAPRDSLRRLLSRSPAVRWLYGMVRGKSSRRDEHGFWNSFPDLRDRASADFPYGSSRLSHIVPMYWTGEVLNPYAYVAWYVLAMFLEDLQGVPE